MQLLTDLNLLWLNAESIVERPISEVGGDGDRGEVKILELEGMTALPCVVNLTEEDVKTFELDDKYFVKNNDGELWASVFTVIYEKEGKANIMIASPKQGGDGKVMGEVGAIEWLEVEQHGNKIRFDGGFREGRIFGDGGGKLWVHYETEGEAELAVKLVQEKVLEEERKKGSKVKKALGMYI